LGNKVWELVFARIVARVIREEQNSVSNAELNSESAHHNYCCYLKQLQLKLRSKNYKMLPRQVDVIWLLGILPQFHLLAQMALAVQWVIACQ